MPTITPPITSGDSTHCRNLVVDELVAYNGPLGAATVIATGGTINTAATNYVRLAPAAAITGVIMQPGSYHGQQCIVENISVAASTITFAASGTSNVGDGTSAVLTGPTFKTFIWDSVASLWYHN